MLTMQAVAAELARLGVDGADLARTVKAMAHGALMGARGNSGVIISQVLRGIADVLAGGPSATGRELKAALRRAADLAYESVAHPVEGTILTVARAAADAAGRVDSDALADVVRAAAAAAAEALAHTPDQLPALKAAGVVDAGGRGLVLVLDALARVITGDATGVAAAPAGDLVVRRDRRGLVAAREAGSEEFGYEVQFLLDARDDALP